jgi:type IV secretory pathway VirJ component
MNANPIGFALALALALALSLSTVAIAAPSRTFAQVGTAPSADQDRPPPLGAWPIQVEPPQLVSAERLKDIPLLRPHADATAAPKGLAILVSGTEGWIPEREAEAKALVAAGLVVLAVHFPSYRKALAASGDGCHYVVADFEALAQLAQRELGLKTYLRPIIVGSGAGAGTFAYAALADAPDNTLGGAVAVGFDNRLDTPVAFCPGASAKPNPAGGFTYGFDHPIPAPIAFLTGGGEAALIDPGFVSGNRVTVTALDPARRIPQMVQAVVEAANGDALKAADLPVMQMKPKGDPRGVALIWSGDGGWRDIDQSLGALLFDKGFAVVGIDSLRYFWSQRTAQEMARDTSLMVKAADPTERLPILLAGYSFGANVLPFAWPHLDPRIRAHTRLVALLAPEERTGFQISVAGWLGISTGDADVVAAILALPPAIALCIHGRDEDDSACLAPRLAPQEVIALPGGHHFDDDYPQLGATILAAFDHRAQAAQGRAAQSPAGPAIPRQ